MSGEILVNGRFQNRIVTGVERYAHAITRRLGDRIRVVKPGPRWQRGAGHFWEQVFLPRQMARGDILWSPANTGPIHVSRQTLTLHDLSAVDHPEWFHPAYAAWHRLALPRLARQVARIITSSQYSKKRIIEFFGLPDDRVVAIHPGVDQAYFRPVPPEAVAFVRRKYGIERDYLLTVGSISARKNLRTLLQAWECFQERARGTSLVVVGPVGHAFRQNETGDLPAAVKMLGYVGDEDLRALYSGALACIFPSLYEGFGLCILEAMACGTPVIAGDASAIPEAVGEAGLLIDPLSPEAMVAALDRITGDAGLRQGLVIQGLERVRDFTWERTAERVWEVLQEALDKVRNRRWNV